MTVTVILAQVLTREGQGRQVKVHQRQVMTSYLGKMKQSTRDKLRCSYCRRYLQPQAASQTVTVNVHRQLTLEKQRQLSQSFLRPLQDQDLSCPVTGSPTLHPFTPP